MEPDVILQQSFKVEIRKLMSGEREHVEKLRCTDEANKQREPDKL
jgi:hypothetical protein